MPESTVTAGRRPPRHRRTPSRAAGAALVVPAEDSSERERHHTKQQFVYATLRSAIIRCELAPDARLIIDDIARQFRVSIIPVREALRLLQSEGLVVSVAHVGATVAPVSHASVVEVFTVMEGLELVASRTAAISAGSASLARLADLVARMDRALESGTPQRWAELNTRFHLTISELAGMPILQEMMQRAFDYWDRVRRLYFDGVLSRRAELAQAEHHVILQAIQTRDLPALERAIRSHNQGALAAYTSYLSHGGGRLSADRGRG
jgi:DNA-binding GntR family transcriptional regulator